MYMYVYIYMNKHSVLLIGYWNVYCIAEIQVLLLTDLVVLMEKSEDKDKNKYYLRCHTLIDAVKEKEEVSEYMHS